jgi:hypothetical protein
MSAEAEVERELTGEEIETLRALIEVRTIIAKYQESEAKLKSQLAVALDEVTHGLIEGEHVLTISRSHPERFDLTAFREDHGLLARSYTRPAETPVVKVLPRMAAKPAIFARGARLLES